MEIYLKKLYSDMIAAMGVEGLEISDAKIRFFQKKGEIPESVSVRELANITYLPMILHRFGAENKNK